MIHRAWYPSVLLLAALLLVACAAAGPRPIAYDRDVCGFCRMTVGDPRYGTELVTTRGRVYTFDSVECLASYYLANESTTKSVWVTDARGKVVPAETVRFVRAAGTTGSGSPMGLGLRAASAGPLAWSDVLALVAAEGLPTADRRAAT